PWNCGESGAKCIGPMGIGDCIDDECQGRLVECRIGGTNCDDTCADHGGVCAEDRCEGVTAFGWSLTSVDHSETMCTLADKKTATALTIGCRSRRSRACAAAARRCLDPRGVISRASDEAVAA